MATLQGLIVVLLGVFLLGAVYRSLSTGWLPCGHNLFKGQLRFYRDGQPFGYWLMFAVYTLGGLWAAQRGIGILVGTKDMLPWR